MRKADIARKARDTIAGHWYQGDYTDAAGHFCALGGIAVAVGQTDGNFDEINPRMATAPKSSPEAIEVKNSVEKVIREQYPEWNFVHYFSLVPDWNDAEGRTEDEVLAVFDKAALLLEEQDED